MSGYRALASTLSHAVSITSIHVPHPGSYGSHWSSGWGSRIFGWVVQAAIWHVVGSIFRRFPILGTIGMIVLAAAAIWFVVRWIGRRRNRRAPARFGS